MKIAEDYIKHPSPKKQKKLQQVVVETLQKDPVLLTWFNTMFNWQNTEHGVEISYKIKIPQIP